MAKITVVRKDDIALRVTPILTFPLSVNVLLFEPRWRAVVAHREVRGSVAESLRQRHRVRFLPICSSVSQLRACQLRRFPTTFK